MLALCVSGGKACARQAGSSRRNPHSAVSGRRGSAPRTRRAKLGPSGTCPGHPRANTACQAVPDDKNILDSALARRAAAIAQRLLQQREQAGDAARGATPPKTALDQSLTALLTSLLGTLADGSTITTATTKASPATSTTTTTANPSDALLQLLTQWADEFLALPADDISPAPASSSSGSSANAPSAMGEDVATSVAKTLFMQLLTELLPPAAGAPGVETDDLQTQQQQQQPSLGRGLLAATAAAFTAREAAARLQQRRQPADTATGSSRRTVEVDGGSTTGSTTDSFDPDAWEAAARAAAEAAQAETHGPTLTPELAAAAVASNTRDFSPDAWEQWAAAAAAAAAEDEQSPRPRLTDSSRHRGPSDTRLALPTPCWAVNTLAEALQAATAAATAALSHPRGSTDSAAAAAQAGRTPSVQGLLLLPASAAAQQLLQLPAADRSGLLLLLCGAEQSCPAAAARVGLSDRPGWSGFGSRGDAWLLTVLEGVAPELGLLETGVLLAAVHDRYGEDVFLRAATTLLPLTDTTHTALTLAPASAPPPAAALQALLLHWLLGPQLAAAGLPLLPGPLLLRLLPQVVGACSLRQLTAASHWGSLWPLTRLQGGADSTAAAAAAVNTSSGSSSSSGSSDRLSRSDWQVTEPQLESVVTAEAWCGFTGAPLPWLAHVAASAAARLVLSTTASSVSSSSSAQLSQGAAAAAANDARAVLGALLRGLEPAEPLLLLLMQAVQELQPGLAGVAAGSTTERVWKQQQLQLLLLEAYSGTALPVVSIADVIHRALGCMWKAGGAAAAVPSMQQQRVLAAAAAVLAGLPPQQLQQELHTLLSLHQEAGSSRQTQHSHTAALGSILAVTAAAADAAQAAAMLAVLPMPYWVDAWAAFVSPAAGCFCWNRCQLATQLQAITLPSIEQMTTTTTSSSSASWGQVKAAWEVVAAHFNLQAVVQEVATRPQTPAAAVSSGAAAVSSPKPFDASKPYGYQPGRPFSGDGWDQHTLTDSDPSIGSSSSGQTVPCFAGSLGVFVGEVLAAAPLPVAAAHVAALAEVLPAQAFARVAAVLVPRLVTALDTLPTAGPARSSSSSTSGKVSLDSLGGLQLQRLSKGLLKLYGTLPELPEAPAVVQLLAVAAPALPLDRLPQLLTAASDISSRLRDTPWVPGAAQMGAAGDESSPELTPMRQLELVVAAAAGGRDAVGLSHLLFMCVRQLPLREAHVAFRVLQGLGAQDSAAAAAGVGLGAGAHQQLPVAAVEEASSILRQRCDDAATATVADAGVGGRWAGSAMGLQPPKQEQQQSGEVVWQLGQSAAAADTPAAARAALGDYVQGWDSPWTATAAAGSNGGSSGGSSAFDRDLIRQLVEVVDEIPAAPPAGSWPMDAMHSPSYTAPLLKRCLALLVGWTPSCPAAAALAAQQVSTLVRKRAWTAAEAAAFLQRLPLSTALQLLLEANSSSSSSSKRCVLVGMRPKLLRALADWQGSEAVEQGFRELLVVYSGQGLALFAEVLSDLRLALSEPSTAAAGAADIAPNAYVGAVLRVLGVLLPPASSSSSSAWPQQLAAVLAQVSLEVPETVTVRLAEQIGRSFADSQQKPSSTTPATAAWQTDAATLLAALPDAAASAPSWDWVPAGVAVAAAVAEAAGSTAVLAVIRSTLQTAALNPTAKSAWAAAFAAVLGNLQGQGLLTCGVTYRPLNPTLGQYGVSAGGSSSMGERFSSGQQAGFSPATTTPSCISLQLLQLLQGVHCTDRSVSLQEAAAALLAVQEGLGRAFPMAVAAVLGGGRMLQHARGYQALAAGGVGTDCADAAAALECATADAAGRLLQPTGAALPAATTAAARQLSEALARCHELLPDHIMAAVVSGLAAVLPWTDVDRPSASNSSSNSSGGNSGSSGSSGVTCPAELETSQGGWAGVTQVLLITSSLLTASCRVWGVDKGTQVAASLIQKLTTPAAGLADAAVGGSGRSRQGLPRSMSAGQLQGSAGGLDNSNSSTYPLKRSVTTVSLPTTTGRTACSSSSSSHAARAEAALFRATTSSRAAGWQGDPSQAQGAAAKLRGAAGTGRGMPTGLDSHADRAGAALLRGANSSSSRASRQAEGAAAKLRAAAGTGGGAQAGSHASKAGAALLAASDGMASSSSSHASRAEAKLLQAAIATGGEAVPGSQAARAKAALLQAAATGLASAGGAGAGQAVAAAGSRGSDSHAQHAQHTLLQALASGTATPAAAAAAAVEDGTQAAELAALGTAQLLSAADAWYWPGLTTAKGLVQGVLYPKHYTTGGTAARVAGDSSRANVQPSDVLSPCQVAAALAAALPRLATGLPAQLTAEVLGQTWGMVPEDTWSRCLTGVAAAVAAAPAAVTGTAAATAQVVGASGEGQRQLLALLQATAASLQQQLEPSRQLPAAYAGLLSAAASKLPEGQVLLLLRQMLTGAQEGRKGLDLDDVDHTGFSSGFVAAESQNPEEGLTSEGFAQLLLELSRPTGAATSSSSSSSSGDAEEQQLVLVAAAASAVFGPPSSAQTAVSSSSTGVDAVDAAAALSGRLYQAGLLPRVYLTLLLLPHLSTAQHAVCVKQLGLTSGTHEAPAAAVAVLEVLCNTLAPGHRLPLGSYAQLLAAALDVTRVQDFGGVGFTDARLCLEFEQQQTLRQLLAGVVQVLGTFRGMRRQYSSPLGAQLVLPAHDLAAALCYSWQLLPGGPATALAEAAAAALGQLDSSSSRQRGVDGWEVNSQLVTVLQLLPAAASEGFGKGPELWQPLLHAMAVAGGLGEPQEASLTRRLLSVVSFQQQQQQVRSHPLQLDDSSSSGGAGGGQFADPAAVTAALSGAAAVSHVGLSAGRVTRGTAGGQAAAAAAAGPAAGAKPGVGGNQQQQQHKEEEEEEEKGQEEVDLTEADAALLTTAAAAYLCAALTGFTPLVVLAGSMSTLLVAAAGTAANRNSSSNKAAGKVDTPPPSPRTPTGADTAPASRPAGRRQSAAMGGRTKAVRFAEPYTVTGTGTVTPAADSDAAAVWGYGATTAAAAAAGGGGAAGAGDLWAQMGSLAVDPDESVRKIKSHAGQLPLDEALMEVVPLLLLPSDASSFTWPLLGLSAVLYSKYPGLHTLVGQGGSGSSSLTNQALAATLAHPDGPLAAVMNASELLAATGGGPGFSDSSSSSSGSRRELLAALAAAEAVSPHAVAMQLAARLLDALWAVLTNSCTASAGSTASTPAGAAAAWQQIAVHLLAGVEAGTAVKLLSGFAHRQQGNWESQLQALAVAAALDGQQTGSRSSKVLGELLGQVCDSNSYPPLSFLSLLLHTADLPLSSSDTAAVLAAAFEQLVAHYTIQLPAEGGRVCPAAAAADRQNSSGRRGGVLGGVGAAGDFDGSWGLDALAGAQGLWAGGDQGLGEALSGFGSSEGPQYRATSSFAAGSGSSSSSSSVGGAAAGFGGGAAARTKLSPVPDSVLGLLGSVVGGACARGQGQAVEAVAFLSRVLRVSHSGADSSLRAGAGVQEGVAGRVLVLSRTHEQQLLQLVLLAVDCSLGRDQSVAQPAAAVVGCQEAAGVLLELLGMLGDRGHLGSINEVVSAVCKASAEQYTSTGAAARAAGTSVSWVDAEVVGELLTCAAEGVRRAEGGVLSAAKPGGGLFLATAADSLFGDSRLPVEQCLVLLSAVAAAMPDRLALQVVAAAAGRLHSVMPQAVAVVRQVARRG